MLLLGCCVRLAAALGYLIRVWEGHTSSPISTLIYIQLYTTISYGTIPLRLPVQDTARATAQIDHTRAHGDRTVKMNVPYLQYTLDLDLAYRATERHSPAKTFAGRGALIALVPAARQPTLTPATAPQPPSVSRYPAPWLGMRSCKRRIIKPTQNLRPKAKANRYTPAKFFPRTRC